MYYKYTFYGNIETLLHQNFFLLKVVLGNHNSSMQVNGSSLLLEM